MSKSLATLLMITTAMAGTAVAQRSEPHPQETAAVQLIQAADQAIAENDYATAVASLKQAAKIMPDDMDLQFKLASALLKADRMPEMWQVLRQAAIKDSSHEGIARGLLSYWQMFDQQGLFNCRHESIDKVIEVLGDPDSIVKGPDRDRYIWGFLAVEVKHGQRTIYQTMDLRGLQAEHLTPREYVDLGTDGKRVPGHRTLTKATSMVEFVMPEERIQNWTELLCVQRLHGLATRNATVREIAEGMMASLGKTNPQRKYRILSISDDDKSVTFEWTAPATDEYQAQHEVARMMRGAVDVHRIAFTVRGTEQMDEALRATWLGLFSQASLKAAGDTGLRSVHETSFKQQAADTSAKSPGNSHELAWQLGNRLSIAVFAHAQKNAEVAKPNLVGSLRIADQLNISLPQPFERTDDLTANVTQAVGYLFEDTLAEMHRKEIPDDQVATFELAARTNTLAMVCTNRDLTEKSMVMINKAAQRSPFPKAIVAALNERVDAHGQPREIRQIILKLHADARNYLAGQQSDTNSRQAISPAKPRIQPANSQVLYINGSKLGEVTASGEVWIAGDKVGTITHAGEIWVNGGKEGEITSEGEIWKAGNKIGDLTADGEVWRDGNQVGSIEQNGDVWLNGSNVGRVKGGSHRSAAVVLFFGFYDLGV